MKRNILLPSLLIAAAALTAQAGTPASSITMVEGMINVDIALPLNDMDVSSNQITILTPYLANGTDTLRLESLGLYGRNAYIRHIRGNDNGIPTPATAIRASKAPEIYTYHAMVPYQPWIDGATLNVTRATYGCAGCSDGQPQEMRDLSLWRAPRLDTSEAFVYAQAQAETVKERAISGRANVEFPVNQTTLLPDFRNNHAELAKVRASVDSVRNDADVTITSMSITGFASPEGSYANNERLARGRTEALRTYVENLYAFPRGLVATASVPEDWAGLRQWVEQSNIASREGLLAIIDDQALAPDPRDRKLRASYPQDYAFLLANVYPSLRHTDYRIAYTIRSYSDPAEILEVMRRRPGNLSLNEFFVAASSLQPGSDEYNEVFDIAVRMYPDDPVANLNAANTAMRRGDTAAAARYLQKAGDTPAANHARGVLAMMQADYDTAQPLLEASRANGNTQADALLRQLDALRAFKELRTK